MVELKEEMVTFVQEIQNRICLALEQFEGEKKFQYDEWTRPGGGGGDTRTLAGGQVFEKAGVNSSVVFGQLSDQMKEKFGSNSHEFFATGVSLVIHPYSPQIPTVHANYRYFEQDDRWWFGGGADLTPYTMHEDWFKHFHKSLKSACDFYSEEAYDRFKKECDEYFYIPHRKEHRGIGGIFFDYLSGDARHTFEFVKKAGESFLEAYIPMVEDLKKLSFSDRQKEFQEIRRGRYVEFNLIYDRGTKFGLETQGNIESILMSLPPEVQFHYKPNLEKSPEEKELMKLFQKPIDWVS